LVGRPASFGRKLPRRAGRWVLRNHQHTESQRVETRHKLERVLRDVVMSNLQMHHREKRRRRTRGKKTAETKMKLMGNSLGLIPLPTDSVATVGKATDKRSDTGAQQKSAGGNLAASEF